MRTMIMNRALVLAALTTLMGFALASPAAAAPTFCGTNKICYDDITGTFIDWTGINETVQTADDAPATALDGLYGTPSGGGNTLIFDPSSFDATSSNGAGFDQTHSTLNATVMANVLGEPIESLTISEFGDYTLTSFPPGGGTNATAGQATIGGQIIILESAAFGSTATVFNIDDLDGVLSVSYGGGFDIAGGFYGDITASGAGTTNWTIDYFLDLAGLGVTKLEVQLNNILFANSEVGTDASIQKKVSLTVVPEPGTFALVSLGMLGLAVRRRLQA